MTVLHITESISVTDVSDATVLSRITIETVSLVDITDATWHNANDSVIESLAVSDTFSATTAPRVVQPSSSYTPHQPSPTGLHNIARDKQRLLQYIYRIFPRV